MSKRKPTSKNLWMETEINSQRLAQKEWQEKYYLEILFSNQLVHKAAVKENVFFLFLTSKIQSLVILPKKQV